MDDDPGVLRRAGSGVSVILLGALLAAASTLPYRDGPPPAHTGGFGEPTCRECHFDAPLDASPGSWTFSGYPSATGPGSAIGSP